MNSLAAGSSEAFERTKDINHLNESIHTFRQLLEHRPPKLLRFGTFIGLLETLCTRSEISPGHCMQDLQEVIELYPKILDDGRDVCHTGRQTRSWLSPA